MIQLELTLQAFSVTTVPQLSASEAETEEACAPLLESSVLATIHRHLALQLLARAHVIQAEKSKQQQTGANNWSKKSTF